MRERGWYQVYRDGHITGPHFGDAPSGNVSSHRTREAAERAANRIARNARRESNSERSRSLEDVE